MTAHTISPIHRRVVSLVAHPALLLVALTIAACSEDARSPEPTGVRTPAGPFEGKNTTRSNQRVLFASNRDVPDEQLEIYSMNPDGTGVTRLTYSPAADLFAVSSPDGKRIAFTSMRDDPAGEVYVMNADGTGVLRLTFSPGIDGAPSWSKDGKQLAFISSRDAEDPTINNNDSTDVYIMNVDGTGVTRLTWAPLRDATPMISPDGRRIAFVSGRDNEIPGGTELYVMNTDGTNVTRLTLGSLTVSNPSWDPHSRRIAYSTYDGIFVINADGSGKTQLTFGSPGQDIWPSWSADGTKIAFTSVRDGNYEIYSMNADGTDPARLTNNPAVDILPRWSR